MDSFFQSSICMLSNNYDNELEYINILLTGYQMFYTPE